MSDVIAVGITLDTSAAYEALEKLKQEVAGVDLKTTISPVGGSKKGKGASIPTPGAGATSAPDLSAVWNSFETGMIAISVSWTKLCVAMGIQVDELARKVAAIKFPEPAKTQKSLEIEKLKVTSIATDQFTAKSAILTHIKSVDFSASKAMIGSVTFGRTSFSTASYTRGTFLDADFRVARYSTSHFARATFSGAVLRTAPVKLPTTMSGVRFSGTIFSGSTRFATSTFNSVKLTTLTVSRANYANAIFRSARFPGGTGGGGGSRGGGGGGGGGSRGGGGGGRGFTEMMRSIALMGVGMRGANAFTMVYLAEGATRFISSLERLIPMTGVFARVLGPVAAFVWPVAGATAFLAITAAIPLMVSKISSGLYSLAKPFAELQDMQSSFKMTFSDIGDAAEGSAREFHKHFKVAMGEVYKSYVQMSMALQEKGLGESQALQYTETMHGRAADLGAAFVGETNDMLSAIQSAMNKQFRPLRTQAGVLLSQRDVNREVNRMQNTGYRDIDTQQLEQYVILKSILDQTAKTAGQFDRDMAAGSLKLQQQAVDAAWITAMEDLGEAIAPVVLMFQQFSIETAESWSKWFKENQQLFVDMAPVLQSVIKSLMEFSQWVTKIIGSPIAAQGAAKNAVAADIQLRAQQGQSTSRGAKLQARAAWQGAFLDELMATYFGTRISGKIHGSQAAMPVTQQDIDANKVYLQQQEDEKNKAVQPVVTEPLPTPVRQPVDAETAEKNIYDLRELHSKFIDDITRSTVVGFQSAAFALKDAQRLSDEIKGKIGSAKWTRITEETLQQLESEYKSLAKVEQNRLKQARDLGGEARQLNLEYAKLKPSQGGRLDRQGQMQFASRGIEQFLEKAVATGDTAYIKDAESYNSFLQDIQKVTDKLGTQSSVQAYQGMDAMRLASRVWTTDSVADTQLDYTKKILDASSEIWRTNKANNDVLKDQIAPALRNIEQQLPALATQAATVNVGG